MIRLTTTIACAVTAASLATAARAELTLIREGQDPCPIYQAARPAGQERTAAAQLASYLKAISGAEFPVQAVPETLPERGIFIGPLDPALAEGLGPDDFRIRVDGQRLHIAGGSPKSTLYGVFALLEDHLGCRWWSRNEEHVPSGQTTLTLAAMDRTVRCPFSMYGVWNREAQSGENQFVFKARTKGTEVFSGNHTLYPLLTPYAEAHPEIYPMNKTGERKANKLHFCYLAPGIAEALADALSREVEKRKGNVKGVIYFAGMGDWYGGMCECADCKAVYEEEAWTDPDGRRKKGVTGTLLRMINRTAELLEEKYPGIRVGTFAYMSLEAPPAKTVPRDNVVLWVPRLRHCTVHAATECGKNASFRRNVERWCELAPGRVYIWEYAAHFGGNFMNPFPCLSSMAANLAYYRSIGIRGVEIQGNYVSTGGDLAVLKNYVWRKLFWNPELDARALLTEFCEGYYGPAAADILAYVDTLEKSVRGPEPVCADEFAGQSYLTAAVRAEMRRLRGQALASAAGAEPYTRRVLEATVGMEVLDLWKAGPLAEEGDKLIRTDLGGYTYPRALEMLAHTREASPKEWGLFRGYHLSVPPMHGGPLVRLAAGDVEVRVAPALNGRLRQILFRGEPLLYVETNHKEKGYPQLGGSDMYAGARTYTLEGEPTDRALRMVADSGISAWSANTKLIVGQTVRMTDEGAIEIAADVRMVADRDTRNATVTTVYLAPKDPAGFGVEVLGAEGGWTAVSLADGGKADLPAGATALRLRLPGKGCAVIDRFLAPAVTSGSIAHDAAKGLLTTVVGTAAVPAPKTGTEPLLTRRIEVQPLP